MHSKTPPRMPYNTPVRRAARDFARHRPNATEHTYSFHAVNKLSGMFRHDPARHGLEWDILILSRAPSFDDVANFYSFSRVGSPLLLRIPYIPHGGESAWGVCSSRVFKSCYSQLRTLLNPANCYLELGFRATPTTCVLRLPRGQIGRGDSRPVQDVTAGLTSRLARPQAYHTITQACLTLGRTTCMGAQVSSRSKRHGTLRDIFS